VKLLKYIAGLVAFLLYSTTGYSQGYSSKGKEFWTTYMTHINGVNGNSGSQMNLYITSDVSTTGNVNVADGSFTQSFAVAANQITTIAIPASAYIADEGQYLKGVHITAVKPIAVYAHIYASSVSGATLLLPVNTMGKDYYSINYKQLSNNQATSYSSFAVIATEDNTTVEITPSAALLSGKPANSKFTLLLKKGELYEGLSKTDLTGTIIRSVSTASGGCKKIAVFSGSSKIGIGCESLPTGSSDNLFQQVYPTSAWGKNYITAPLKDRNYDVYRIVLSKPNTNVQVNGVNINNANFVNGLYYEFQSQETNVITADQPIQVVQYAVTQGQTVSCRNVTDDVGDPEMIYLTPLEQSIDNVTLYSASQYLINVNKHFINVIIPATAVSSFKLDGALYNAFTSVPGNSAYSYAQINVGAGAHNIQAAEGFNAIAYGFGNAESYGYAAGTNLKNLNQYITLNPPGTTETKISGCSGVEYKLQLVLPYQTTNIKWNFNDGKPPVVDAAPVSKTIVRDGKTLYLYEYAQPIKYSAGDYTVTATVFNPSADECGSNQDIEFSFNITDYPEARFTPSANPCLNSAVTFTDESDAKNSTIKTWLWDFGDGQPPSTEKSPTHTYATPGDYSVTLTVSNENGCTSLVSAPQTIHVYAKPLASFEPSSPNCETQAISFTDKSTSADGEITKWEWDFGDGSATSNNKDETHAYANAGRYTVKLKVTTINNCTSETSKVIVINPLPIADFALPDVCLSDAFASFTNKSSIADGTESEFTYLWDFGDPNATAANPNTLDLRDPKHKYTKVGDYIVTLTVTSKYGCKAVKKYTLTVNGDIPKADFAVNNLNSLCSSNDVIFTDKSTVNFGNITRIGWIFDYNNHPSDVVWFDRDQLPADRLFRHNYGEFNTPGTKTYQVKMIVYSGQTCVNESAKDIVIKANPMVTLSQLGSVCLQDNPIQVTVTEVNNYAGTGTFSGPGITVNGLFDPSKAGVGTHDIIYVFTAQNGCDYTATQQVVVNPMPVIKLDRSVVMLEGAPTRLNATASGTGLTYKWMPSAGLDHDDVLNPLASPSNSVTYTLTVTTDKGCNISAQVDVTVLKLPMAPNTFTPNGDGINDFWQVEYLYQYANCTVDVYNRYGEKVYSSIGYAVPWDGRYKGTDLPQGTYYYVINPKNGRKLISGSVTLIR
jgi:gliding motility-associated-like protein